MDQGLPKKPLTISPMAVPTATSPSPGEDVLPKATTDCTATHYKPASKVTTDRQATAATNSIKHLATGPASVPDPSAPDHNGHATPRSVPSTPLTLDDLLPLLTSDKRTSSSSSDALMDLYHQYMRQGSGSFTVNPNLRQDSLRQDSLISALGSSCPLAVGLGGLGALGRGRLGSGLGSGSFCMPAVDRQALQSPKAVRHLQSPKALLHRGSGFGLGSALGTPRSLARLESLGSQGTAGHSPSLAALLSGPIRTPSTDWASWPPLGSTAVAGQGPQTGSRGLAPDRDPLQLQQQQQQQQGLRYHTESSRLNEETGRCKQGRQQQQLQLDAAPSVNGWLPLTADLHAQPASDEQLKGLASTAAATVLAAPVGPGSVGSVEVVSDAGNSALLQSDGALHLPFGLLPQELHLAGCELSFGTTPVAAVQAVPPLPDGMVLLGPYNGVAGAAVQPPHLGSCMTHSLTEGVAGPGPAWGSASALGVHTVGGPAQAAAEAAAARRAAAAAARKYRKQVRRADKRSQQPFVASCNPITVIVLRAAHSLPPAAGVSGAVGVRQAAKSYV